MKRALFISFLFPVLLSAQKRDYVVHLYDRMVYQNVSGAHIQVLDATNSIIAEARSDSSGIFKFSCSENTVTILVDSIPETCDGTQFNIKRSFTLSDYSDTILIMMIHAWIHKEPGTWFFEEATLNFTSYGDSVYCSFDKVDSLRGGYHSMDVCVELYKCGAFSKVELRTMYTTREDSLYGDSLARVRTDRMIAYLKTNGMQNVEFVVWPILYPLRPLKNPDGSLHEECSAVLFRILAW